MVILAGWVGVSVGFVLGAIWGWAMRRKSLQARLRHRRRILIDVPRPARRSSSGPAIRSA
jgi:hypothetical protein